MGSLIFFFFSPFWERLNIIKLNPFFFFSFEMTLGFVLLPGGRVLILRKSFALPL